MMMNESPMMDFSIVVPVYFNEGSLEALYDELDREVFQALSEFAGEIIFIDDGSGDQSYAVMESLQNNHPDRIRAIKLSRNFGQINAIWCGLTHARGRATAVISADGQDPPEYLRKMLLENLREGKEVVICTREEREESAWRKFTSSCFYWFMQKLCFSNMPVGGFDFFSLGTKSREALLRNYQSHGFLQGQILRLGFEPLMIQYTRRAREHGRSRWTFARKVTYLLDGIIGYSFLPLRMMALLGILMALAGFVYALVVLFHRLFFGNPLQGWAPLMIVILVMGGVQMVMLGIIGEYLWRTKAQVTAEPPYIVEAILQAE
ncbi:glycosyltransferase family 2 protein [Pontiella sulfatireligans]|uniref:Putative glycosyltransferase n=1 Tax=Pontiella sulfatireligans TaxID=2750658 RepID=A0A6C2UDN1_9BACT|nr:glycosyltransferase family 2 protein [Pontiella sulfatireligans]VGO18270.1 putative glycosyltransferase [Pontiella sulfatireligans]